MYKMGRLLSCVTVILGAVAVGGEAEAKNVQSLLVWPRSAQRLQPTTLSDLLAAALPKKEGFSWSALLLPSVHWLTVGIGSTPTGISSRRGVARVRANGIKTQMLRQQWEELGWGIELDTEGNEKWGPTTITIFPGFEENGSCFGTGFSGCTFPASALEGPNIHLTRICYGGSGPANITAFEARVSDGRSGTVLYHTDEGSGGQTNSLELTLEKPTVACAKYQKEYG